MHFSFIKVILNRNKNHRGLFNYFIMGKILLIKIRRLFRKTLKVLAESAKAASYAINH